MTRIRTAFFLENQSIIPKNDRYVVANDPLYLMSSTSTPEEPWDREPMFSKWGDTQWYPVDVDGMEQTIGVRYSIVKPEALLTGIGLLRTQVTLIAADMLDITSGYQSFGRIERSFLRTLSSERAAALIFHRIGGGAVKSSSVVVVMNSSA